MAPLELLNIITSRGGTVRAEGGLLRVTPPPEGLEEADIAALKACKAELLELVRAATQDADARVSVESEAAQDGASENSGLPQAAETRADNPKPPDCHPGDRVRGYDGERWKVGTVLSVLPDDEWTAPGCAGLVLVQLDHTPHETAFHRERLWPVETQGEAQTLSMGICAKDREARIWAILGQSAAFLLVPPERVYLFRSPPLLVPLHGGTRKDYRNLARSGVELVDFPALQPGCFHVRFVAF